MNPVYARALHLIVVAVCATSCADKGDGGALVALDSGPRPLLYVAMNSPRYGASGVAADISLGFTILEFDSSRLGELDAANQRLAKECVVESYPQQTPVSGKWSGTQGAEFTPDATLSPGDYVVRFPAAGADLRVSPKPYNVFRVGSALRLTEVGLLGEKLGAADLVNLSLMYSESPSSAEEIVVTVEQLKEGKWVAIQTARESITSYSLASPVDPSRRVRVAVVAPSLDGAWTGAAGSGPAVVEFTPNDCIVELGQVQFFVPPPLDIDLPSGKRRP